MNTLMKFKRALQARVVRMVVSEYESVTKERDDLVRKLDDIWNGRIRDRILHHHPQRVAGKVIVVSESTFATDQDLVSRISIAYRKSIRTPVGPVNSIWLNEISGQNSDTHDLLENGDHDAIARMLRNPHSSMLFFGFESIQKIDAPKNKDPAWVEWQRQLTYDNLLHITRAIAFRRVENPETGIDFDETPEVESILQQLDSAFGFRIEFPNIFAEEIGLETSRGIANYRAIQALYQAWRIKQLTIGHSKPRVLEIGGGLGRTAYYAMKMGIGSYTIVDIPLTGVAQGYFLGRVLGEECVSLWDEHTDGAVKILPPVAFYQCSEHYDLIVNVDSMTEMAESTAREYFDAISTKCPLFLSINHEHNVFTVAQIYQGRDDVRVLRTPCWSRRGYVEELIEFVFSDVSL